MAWEDVLLLGTGAVRWRRQSSEIGHISGCQPVRNLGGDILSKIMFLAFECKE